MLCIHPRISIVFAHVLLMHLQIGLLNTVEGVFYIRVESGEKLEKNSKAAKIIISCYRMIKKFPFEIKLIWRKKLHTQL